MKKIEDENRCFYHDEVHTFTCTRPNPNRQYIKFLEYIAAHPGVTRAEVMNAIVGYSGPGNHSTSWRCLTGLNFLDKYRDGRTIRYFITELGKEKIKEAYSKISL